MVHRLLEIVQDVYSDIMSPPMPAGYEPTAPVVWNEREIKVQGPEEEPIAKQAALKRKNHHKPDFHMPIDLIEDEQRFKIYVDIPGVDKNKNLSLSLNEEGDVLSIEAEKKHPFLPQSNIPDEKLKVHSLERRFGKVKRAFRLPKESHKGKVTAQYNDGVLYIEIEKETRPPKKTIRIE